MITIILILYVIIPDCVNMWKRLTLEKGLFTKDKYVIIRQIKTVGAAMAKWVPMREAAAILKAEGFKVSPNTISRLANRGTIQAKDDPVDARVRLVDLDEVRRLFTYRRSEITDDEEEE